MTIFKALKRRTRSPEASLAKAQEGRPLIRVSPPDREGLESLRVLSSYLESEVAAENNRKNSFEMRSFALISANLAVATLLITMAERFDRLNQLGAGAAAPLSGVAVVLASVSIVLGVAAAIPRGEPSPKSQTELELLSEIRADEGLEPESLLVDIAELRIEQVKRMREINQQRGVLIVGSVAAFGVAALFIVIALACSA